MPHDIREFLRVSRLAYLLTRPFTRVRARLLSQDAAYALLSTMKAAVEGDDLR